MAVKLADAYLTSGAASQLVINTAPGKRVQFIGRHASIYDHVDMPHILRMPNVQITIRPQWGGWAEKWIAACGPFKKPKAVLVRLPFNDQPGGRYAPTDGGYTFIPDHPVAVDTPDDGWTLPQGDEDGQDSETACAPARPSPRRASNSVRNGSGHGDDDRLDEPDRGATE